MEILVGSLIFTMVAMTVSSVMAPIMMAFNRANSLAEYSTVLDSVGNQIANDIMRGVVLETEPDLTLPINSVFPDDYDDGYVMILVRTEGTIEYRTALVGGLQILQRRISPATAFTDVFARDFYRAKNVSFQVTEADDIEQGFNIEVTVDSFNQMSRGAAGGSITRTFAVRTMFTESDED